MAACGKIDVYTVNIPSSWAKDEFRRRIFSILSGFFMILREKITREGVQVLMDWVEFPEEAFFEIFVLPLTNELRFTFYNPNGLIWHLKECMEKIGFENVNVVDGYSTTQIIESYLLLVQDRLDEIEKIAKTVSVVIMAGEANRKFAAFFQNCKNDQVENALEYTRQVMMNEDSMSELFGFLNCNLYGVTTGQTGELNGRFLVNNDFVANMLKGLSVCYQPGRICGSVLNCTPKNYNAKREKRESYFGAIDSFMLNPENLDMLNKMFLPKTLMVKIREVMGGYADDKQLFKLVLDFLLSMLNTGNHVYISSENFIQSMWELKMSQETVDIIGDMIQDIYEELSSSGINNENYLKSAPVLRILETPRTLLSKIISKIRKINDNTPTEPVYFDGYYCLKVKGSNLYYSWNRETGEMWFYSSSTGWVTKSIDNFLEN